MGIRDKESGDLVVDVVNKSIENTGVLSEDGGGMRVGVPGGGARSISEVVTEEGDCVSKRASERVPVLRKISWRMSGMGSGFTGSVLQEKRQVRSVHRESWLIAYTQSQTTTESCQKWE